MQNKTTLKDFIKLIDSILNSGHIRTDYYLAKARSAGAFFSEKTHMIEYNYTDQLTQEYFEYSISYTDFFNGNINKQFTTLFYMLGETEMNIDIYEEWVEALAKLNYYSKAYKEILDSELNDNELLDIVYNITEKLDFLSEYINSRIKLTRFYDKNNQIHPESKKTERISVKIAGREFACLIRLLKEEGVIEVKKGEGKKTGRVMANAFSFATKDTQSPDALTNAYVDCITKDGVDHALLKSIQPLFINIKNLIDKLTKV